MKKTIDIIGAREHNLKNVSVSIKRNQLVVVTGLSGSGKSSLIIDTLFSEGQRRYLESLSSYARQFIGSTPKPLVDRIDGLSPTIAIQQKTVSKNPRSTVGTITEILDYMRLLFARCGTVFCPHCQIKISSQTTSAIIEQIKKQFNGKKIILLAPLVEEKKGTHLNLLNELKQEGFRRVRINQKIYLLEEEILLSRYQAHTIELIIDRMTVDKQQTDRLSDSTEIAIAKGEGRIIILDDQKETMFSERFACPSCLFSYKEISHRLFSFNSPVGFCSTCSGIGSYLPQEYQSLASHYDKIESEKVLENLNHFITQTTCIECEGKRLNKEALSIRLQNYNIAELCSLSIQELFNFFDQKLFFENKNMRDIANKILIEIKNRLQFLLNVGLSYLSLERSSATLSGGESQRIRLASQLGSSLVNVLYILDEPSIGLHQRDNDRLLNTLQDLKKLGNTLVVIEHDEDTMKISDQIIDVGPFAGEEGGHIIFSGSYSKILKCRDSLTGQYLNGKKNIPIPHHRRQGSGQFLKVIQATKNNLKNISVSFPLETLTCITGVSGSGKSTLINEVLLPSLKDQPTFKPIKRRRYKRRKKTSTIEFIQPQPLCQEIEGRESIHSIQHINQNPIGRTPRSNPCTYTGIFTHLRDLFAQLPESIVKGYKPGRFSFNVKGGRCENCQGGGVKKVEMHFMPDMYVTCSECQGQRFNRETLQIRYKGKTISDCLNLSINEATSFFKAIPTIFKRLDVLTKIGLGYLKLGQPATTLSGGEAQRIKLAKELSKTMTKNALYILDEPTTGLHFHDINKLIEILHRLVDRNHTVIVIEHNLDIIKNADYIIDLGPEGGKHGGQIVGTGSPEQLIKNSHSHTGQYLKNKLSQKQ